MAEFVGDGPRVKFAAERIGEFPAELHAEAKALLDAVLAMESAGCCPVLDDGLVGGNGALRVGDRLLVTASGRAPGSRGPEMVVCVEAFDVASWSARFLSAGDTRPTSDTPLHWAALMQAPAQLGWTESPRAALHGHGLATMDEARAAGMPISDEETTFSTPPDREALMKLMKAHPYPHHHAWVRRGHGFFVLGPSLELAQSRTLALA